MTIAVSTNGNVLRRPGLTYPKYRDKCHQKQHKNAVTYRAKISH
jgi:hypothetical protein